MRCIWEGKNGRCDGNLHLTNNGKFPGDINEHYICDYCHSTYATFDERIKDEIIQTLSEKELKLIDNVVHLTSTTEEENIFHQGFYSGYRTCEKEDYKKGSENFIMGAEWVEEKINSISDSDVKIQAEIESVGEYLSGSPYQKTYEDGFIKGVEWFKELIKSKL